MFVFCIGVCCYEVICFSLSLCVSVCVCVCGCVCPSTGVARVSALSGLGCSRKGIRHKNVLDRLCAVATPDEGSKPNKEREWLFKS